MSEKNDLPAYGGPVPEERAPTITRRFFLGASALFVTSIFLPARTRWEQVRGWARALGRLRRRWVHGIEPRWVEWTDTQYVRSEDDMHARGREPGMAYVRKWRELRWPDNDELVMREPDVASVYELPPDGWHDAELGAKPPESFKGRRHPGEIERWAAMVGDYDKAALDEFLVKTAGVGDVRGRLDDHEWRFAHDCKRTLEAPKPSPVFTDEERELLEPALEAVRKFARNLPKPDLYGVHRIGEFGHPVRKA